MQKTLLFRFVFVNLYRSTSLTCRFDFFFFNTHRLCPTFNLGIVVKKHCLPRETVIRSTLQVLVLRINRTPINIKIEGQSREVTA